MSSNFAARVGFTGLRGVGRGLVKNMLKHGIDVTVNDLNQQEVTNAVELGAKSKAIFVQSRVKSMFLVSASRRRRLFKV